MQSLCPSRCFCTDNLLVSINAAPSLGLATLIVSETAESGSFPLEVNRQAAPLTLDPADWPGVLRAGADLQADVERVTGIKPAIATNSASPPKPTVIIGTMGKSPLIDGLVKSGKLKAEAIAGKWESFIITTVTNPLPGVDQALVIAGSDKRGTIYGIYDLSEQIGVSPWYWWADVPASTTDALFVKAGTYVAGPAGGEISRHLHQRRGPCLRRLGATRNSAASTHKIYTHVFELLLRLKGNYLWPAMWDNAFNEDDPLNPKLADEYGIVMGTSHHEPMMRAQKEWSKHGQSGKGSGTTPRTPKAATSSGPKASSATRTTKTSSPSACAATATSHDRAGDMSANIDAAGDASSPTSARSSPRHVNPDVTKVPQVWALYKEVQELLRTWHARAGRRDAALVRRQLGQHPPPAHARRTQAQRRRRHLLPLRLRRRPAQLQVAQHQSRCRRSGSR